MKKIIIVFLLAFMVLFSSCKSEEIQPIPSQDDEAVTQLIDTNPPQLYLDNFRTYTMAFIIFTDSEYSIVPDKMISVVNGAKSKFRKNFARMTYNRITIDTSDDIYVINVGYLRDSVKDDNSLNGISQNLKGMLELFDGIDSYDYITVFNTWPTGQNVDFHESRYSSDSKLRGINYIGYIENLENNNEDELIDQTTLALLHETSHEWGAYEGAEFGILNNDRIHYNANVVASDPLGGCPWFITKSGKFDCTYYKSDRREFLDVTLFIMGVIPEDEVDPILIINEDGSYRTVTIQELLKASTERELNLEGIAPTDSDGDGTLDWQENQGMKGDYTDHLRSDAVNLYDVPTEECVDSDGGIVVNIKGITRFQEAYQDICLIKESPTESSSTVKCSGTNCYVSEYYCDSQTGNPIGRDISCSQKGFSSCRNGACQN